MNFSNAWLFSSFLVSTIGFGFFMYGKKQARIPQLATGVAMMVFPAFVTSAMWMLVITCALVGGLWIAVRNGL